MAAFLTHLLKLRRVLRFASSPIDACLEAPARNERVTDVINVSGWAFSRDAPIVEVLANVAGQSAVELAYGGARPDVVAAYQDRTPLRCGFGGSVVLDGVIPSHTTLRVMVIDAKGHRREMVSSITINRIRLAVDLPEAHSANGSPLIVRGWALSRTSRIVEVYAGIGGKVGATLAYGMRRPDIAAAYSVALGDRCGFEGVLDLHGAETDGTHSLVVRATDEFGETAAVEIPVRLVRRGQALCQIERARLIGDQLEVGGWVAWPESVSPRVLRLNVGGVFVAEASPNRSRPDLARGFPMYPAGSVRGFQFVERLNRDTTGPGSRVEIRIEAVDAHHRRLEASTTIVAETHAGKVIPRHVALQVEHAIACVREQLNRAPAVLDWHSGISLKTNDGAQVFGPPTAGAGTLPYLDHTVDVVIVRANGPARLEEASRVASVATIEIRRESAGAPRETATLVWRSIAPPEPVFPPTSIIIPVHNQKEHTNACLAQVIATLPQEFRGEVLIVDDESSDETVEVLRNWAGMSALVRVIRNETSLGFVRSCNRGAEAATGQLLVFLNNDTLPLDDWLSPLTRVLRDDSTVGAVGGKLLYPNGTLQEAGAVIFSDGSGYNVGRNDGHPNAPLYSYAREVDYCSGALLAIGREVFLDLGGFDTRFAPAYYEDADLCFRLREKGYRVCFQPESVVVHIEGASSGTDEHSGVKRHQAVNREKFVSRWRDQLTRQPAPPPELNAAAIFTLAVRAGRKRALVCAPRMPEFDREGGSQRVMHVIDLLQHEGWAVSFVAMDASDGERYAHLLRRRGVATYAGPESIDAGDEYLDSLDDLIAPGQFDLALLAFWHTAERVIPRIRALSPATRVVVDSIDLHFVRAARGARLGTKAGALDAGFADAMAREISTYMLADGVLAVSQREADLINDMTGDHSLAHTVPLMEDLPWSQRSPVSRRGLLFIGNFRHSPNLEGLTFLCEQVLPRMDPRIRAAHPLSVVGNGVTDAVRAVVEGVTDVRLVGWVPSLAPYLEQARVSVVPLLHGAGTKTKLIQALMAGTPSVSTRIGIEGLDLEDGRDVLVADAPDEFAAHIARLLEDSVLWSLLAAEGRARIERAHGPAAVRARFRTVVDGVMNRQAWPGFNDPPGTT